MPCFLKKIRRVKNLLNELGLESEQQLYKKLLQYYSDSELHAISDTQIIKVIKHIYRVHKQF